MRRQPSYYDPGLNPARGMDKFMWTNLSNKIDNSSPAIIVVLLLKEYGIYHPESRIKPTRMILQTSLPDTLLWSAA